MRHTHHLLPKHMGGTDHETNLVPSISITRHAMFHFANWQLHQKTEDYIAWRSLSGKITKAQAIFEAQSLGGKKGGKNRPPELVVELGKRLAEWGRQNRQFMLEVNQENGRKLNEWLKMNPSVAREAHKKGSEKHKKPVQITHIETGDSFIFDSVKAAAKFIGCPSSNLSCVLQRKRKSSGGFFAEFLL